MLTSAKSSKTLCPLFSHAFEYDNIKNYLSFLMIDCALNALAIDKPVEYAKLYLDGTIQIWVDEENTLYL